MALLGRLDEKVAHRLHGELLADNFSAQDPDVGFFTFVRALILRHQPKRILDYGAGRNRYAQDFNPAIDSYLIRDLRDLRYAGAYVIAVDVEDDVLSHPTSAEQHVIGMDGKLPIEDASVDLIVSDYVFEHVEDPENVANELQRVLAPGGWLAVRTPNRWGYLRFASQIVPNRMHSAALRFVQPHRKAIDTFPTHYRLNSLSAMRRHFDKCEVRVVTDSWEPAYFFGKSWLYRMFRLLHRLLPKCMDTAHIFLARKHGG